MDEKDYQEALVAQGDDPELTQVSAAETVPSVADAILSEYTQLQSGLDQQDPTITDYEITGEIGQGAMGSVLTARHRNLKRQVAYKKILPEFIESTPSLSRFLREMQITAQLEHPNIVPVYEFEFTADGSMAYAMKLIHGKTLKELILERRTLLSAGQSLPSELSQSRLLEHFLAVCDAIHYAHSRGVIHRDLKPANLMIGEHAEVYVMDWGIARQIGRFQTGEEQEHSTGLTELNDPVLDETRAGQILGTPRYMSPQQAAGKNKDLDGQTDQFSLALILFEILTCKPAFKAKDTVDLLKRILTLKIEVFEPLYPGEKIARELKAITRKALALQPEERYSSVLAMAQDIRRYQQGNAILAEPDKGFQKGLRWISQHRLRALTIGASMILLTLLSVGGLFYTQQQTLARTQALELQHNHLLGSVSQQAQKIDAHFLKMEGLLRYLAATAQQLIAQAPPSTEPIYPPHPFRAPDQYPAPLFGGKISLDWPTVGFSPNKTMADMQGKLERLLPLRQTLKEVILRSANQEPSSLSPAESQDLIGTSGTPIMWTHVSLAEGVIYMYPGIGFNTPGYDARTRPFYRLSAHKHGVFWGNPYFDPLSGALLPATTAMYDNSGLFLGVAGIDLRFQYVIDQLLNLRDQPQVTHSYLLNPKGEIMIESQAQAADPITGAQDLTRGFDTPVFDYAPLVDAISKNEQGGYVLDQEAAQPRLLVYARLNTLGWYYLVEMPALAESI